MVLVPPSSDSPGKVTKHLGSRVCPIALKQALWSWSPEICVWFFFHWSLEATILREQNNLLLEEPGSQRWNPTHQNSQTKESEDNTNTLLPATENNRKGRAQGCMAWAVSGGNWL